MTTIVISWLLTFIIMAMILVIVKQYQTKLENKDKEYKTKIDEKEEQIEKDRKSYEKALKRLQKELEDIRKSDIVLENALDEMEARIQSELNTQMNWDFVNNKQTIKDVAKLSNPVVKTEEESDWEKSQGQDI